MAVEGEAISQDTRSIGPLERRARELADEVAVDLYDKSDDRVSRADFTNAITRGWSKLQSAMQLMGESS